MEDKSLFYNHKVKDYHWLKVTKEFYRWKKTEGFEKWRRKQFLKQGGLCWYCHAYLPYTRVNVEHKLARSRGGGNNINNLVLACSKCNKDKGSKVLSVIDRTRLNAQNKGRKGTYLKNKQYYDNLYGEYSDSAIMDKLRYL